MAAVKREEQLEVKNKRSIFPLLLAALFLCASFSGCAEQNSGFRQAAEKYLAFLGKNREEVLAGLKLSEKDVSPLSTEICAILDGSEQFCGKSFSTQLFFDSADPETGEALEAPVLVSVKFIYSSPKPGTQDYELANAAYAKMKEEYGDPEPLAIKDGDEHFQSLDALKELKAGPSVSRCADSWAETGHEGICAVLSAELIPNSMIAGSEDSDGSAFNLSLQFRYRSQLP